MNSNQQPRTRLCAAGCGSPFDSQPSRRGWCNACYQRWLRAGKPESGPPDRTRQPRAAAPPAATPADLAEARWARERLETEPQRRVEALIGLACDLARTVQARDNSGRQKVLEKLSGMPRENLVALAMLLADCADPWCLYDRTELAARRSA